MMLIYEILINLPLMLASTIKNIQVPFFEKKKQFDKKKIISIK